MEIETLRALYQEAPRNPAAALQIWEGIPANSPPLLTAYRAAARAVMAEHSFLPFQKLLYLNESLALFREAVAQDPADPEIRTLRFTILHNLPILFRQDSLLQEDRQALLLRLPRWREYGLGAEHLEVILRYLQETKRFSEGELRQLAESMPQP